jgi:hypothetical protein
LGTTNGNTPVDRKIGSAAEIQHKRDYNAPSDGADTRNFIETHDVTKVARKAVPGSGEESADLLQAEQDDRLNDDGGKSPESSPQDNTTEKSDSSKKSGA